MPGSKPGRQLGGKNEESTVTGGRDRDGRSRRAGDGPEEDPRGRREGPRQRLLHRHGQWLRRLEQGAIADSEYECLYTGPALTSDEAGEIQIVADLIARDDVAGIAISPSNAPAMAKILTEKAADIAAKKIAIMTIDADLLPADQGLRTTYFGTHNYGMGVKFCEWLKKLQPNGGKVALMFGNPAAENLNERGYGFRDCMMGEVLTAPTTKGRDPLTGQGGWTEVAPTFTNDDIATANQQFADVLAANPGPHRLRASRRLGPAGLRGVQRHRQAV